MALDKPYLDVPGTTIFDADQARKGLTHDYGQTAWVGTATLAGATPGLAVERLA